MSADWDPMTEPLHEGDVVELVSGPREGKRATVVYVGDRGYLVELLVDHPVDESGQPIGLYGGRDSIRLISKAQQVSEDE